MEWWDVMAHKKLLLTEATLTEIPERKMESSPESQVAY